MNKAKAVVFFERKPTQVGTVTTKTVVPMSFFEIDSYVILGNKVVSISAETLFFVADYYTKVAEESKESLGSVLHDRLQHIVDRLGIETEGDLYGESGHRYNLLSVIEELALCAINRSDRVLRAIEDEGIDALKEMGCFVGDREEWRRSIPSFLNFKTGVKSLDARHDLYRNDRHLIEGTPFGFDRRGYLLFFSSQDPSRTEFARDLGFLIEERELESLENEGLLVIEKKTRRLTKKS